MAIPNNQIDAVGDDIYDCFLMDYDLYEMGLSSAP